MPTPSQQQPDSPHAPAVDTLTLVQAAQPFGECAIIATTLDISPLCAGGPALTDILLTASTGHRETTDAGPTCPAAAGTQSDH